jgi:hypothetical protein
MKTKQTTTSERLMHAIQHVTKDWAKQRKREERDDSARERRLDRLTRPSDYYNFKSAADEVMEDSYLAASANGTLPTGARQVMYQARAFIQDKVGKQLNDAYFTQTLLPDYMKEYDVDWDITFDDRGHFIEPHTGHLIGLGTIAVRNYIAENIAPKLMKPTLKPGHIRTRGAQGCFGAVLLCEKEGFMPLFEHVALANRYDLAIMSPKGMSSTAARTLIDHLCQHQIPLLVLHDFDKAGFSIIGTLQRDTRRYEFKNEIKVIDLGLRLSDVQEFDLDSKSENVFDRGSDDAKEENLRLNGATNEEIEYLLNRRVELNALTSDQLITLIESKLKRYGIKKLVPSNDELAYAYRLFNRSNKIELLIEAELEKIDSASASNVSVPRNLAKRVSKYLKDNPADRWDDAVREIVEQDTDTDADS